MKKYRTLIIGLMVYWCNGLITPAYAQSVGLSVSPPVVEILLSPNNKVVQTYIIKNQGSEVYITPTLHTVTPNGEYGHVTVSPTPLSPTEIPLIATLSRPLNQPTLIQADGSLTLTLTLEGASVDTPIDSYLALVITPSLTSGIANLTSTSPAISALALVTLTPSAVIPASLEVQDFDLPLFHDTYAPFSVRPTLKNEGEVMLRPEGVFKITSPAGKIVHELKLYPNLLLKDSKRIIQGTAPHTLYSIQNTAYSPVPLTWTPAWYNLGPHRVTITITTVGGTKLTEIERVVWFLPIRAIIGILLIAVIIYTMLKYQIKKRESIDTTLE